MSSSKKELSPRNGVTLVVGIVARISGCQNQKEMSLDDQIDHAKEHIEELYKGSIEYRKIAVTKAKGERIDRPELAKVEEACRQGELDVLIFEDLGRLVRGQEAVHLMGIAVDSGIRVMIPNDCIDTADLSWQADALSACAEHVAHNDHCSKRIKQKLMNRFRKSGAAVALAPYGYIKPAGAKVYGDWTKDPDAEGHIAKGAAILHETLNCSAVADYFNGIGVPTGKYCDRKQWDGAMVRRFYANPLLKGMPSRGRRQTVKHHESGRRISIINPDGPIYLDLPHLAYLSPEVFDDLNAKLALANSDFRRKTLAQKTPGVRRLHQDARYPGAHACHCWYCGRPMLWGGNGITANLMCAGDREWRCWNSIGFNGKLAAQQVMKTVWNCLSELPAIDEQYRQLVQAAHQSRTGANTSEWHEVEQAEAQLRQKKEHLASAITEFGLKDFLISKNKELETAERELKSKRRMLEDRGNRQLMLPATVTELRELFEKHLLQLTSESAKMGQLLRRLVPEFHVYLVRMIDGGHLLPRARVKLTLDGIVADAVHVAGLAGILTKVVTLDLFEPAQRERIRPEAARLEAQGIEQRKIARLIAEHPTQTAVFNALELDRLMKQKGCGDPYVMVGTNEFQSTPLREGRRRELVVA